MGFVRSRERENKRDRNRKEGNFYWIWLTLRENNPRNPSGWFHNSFTDAGRLYGPLTSENLSWLAERYHRILGLMASASLVIIISSHSSHPTTPASFVAWITQFISITLVKFSLLCAVMRDEDISSVKDRFPTYVTSQWTLPRKLYAFKVWLFERKKRKEI